MKLCYFDESGTGTEPIVVVTGVVVDSQRMHVTKDHWATLLAKLSQVCGHALDELHTTEFYRGNGHFRTMTGDARGEYITSIVQWFCERKHSFVFSAVHKDQFAQSKASGDMFPELANPWQAGAFHCVLAIQRAHQTLQKTKGQTVLIFDNKGSDEVPLTRLVLKPPTWSDSYYGRGAKTPQLAQIVDAPYFADSKQVPLIQVADFLAYFFRRYAELTEHLVGPKYPEEEARIAEWVNALMKRCIGFQHIYPAKGRCSTADVFYDHCPASLRRF